MSGREIELSWQANHHDALQPYRNKTNAELIRDMIVAAQGMTRRDPNYGNLGLRELQTVVNYSVEILFERAAAKAPVSGLVLSIASALNALSAEALPIGANGLGRHATQSAIDVIAQLRMPPTLGVVPSRPIADCVENVLSATDHPGFNPRLV